MAKSADMTDLNLYILINYADFQEPQSDTAPKVNGYYFSSKVSFNAIDDNYFPPIFILNPM